ncbi:MAG: hypothetical protein SWH68_01810 [Thermodesulfobacteriota bacterium]|nr:hypothetical protein [Thermodesulfobacteriota bacterium]
MKKAATLITASVILILLAGGLFATETARKSLTRTLYPVIATGDQTDLCSAPISNYRLYAIKDGRMQPIPFQIDERHQNGEFVLTGGENPTTDEDEGIFDKNDELVFMARDTGDKLAAQDMLPDNIEAVAELEISDPVTGDTAWAYLISFNFPQEPLETDYVSYKPTHQTISTPYYAAGFNPDHPAAPSDYSFMKALNGSGEDFLDRAKIRVAMRSMGITLHRNEEDIKVKEIGYIDGPVRVVVYNQTTTPLFLGIPASSTKQYTYYYPMNADFGFAVSFPLKPGMFRVEIIDDFKDAIGWTFYNSNNPEGLMIDGETGPADKNLDRSPWDWSVLSDGTHSFWSRWKTPEDCTVAAAQYFNDDMTAEDELEDTPGESPGIGFDFKDGWKELEEDRVEFRLIHFFTRGYTPAMVQEITQVHDAPLEVSENDVDMDG